ncbi:flagellar hook-associated protein 3 [Noviherbaspirillum cavernae]|uniref:Flagellar hook-associated protein 3 n=1 Tax=Noviherbaspirillum cavernae TaxID=2320862 RepID=A0A418WVE4_9BURK|nr:flagellar hook-associated protein FlgL [Noviherbaspirillum cavernae]RJF96684.1 flagellar hook-associated protein 3 [Noviherbaspirillum cavernae]
MRIASSQYESTMTRSLQMNDAKLAHLTQQMASGARVQLPSDDPISAVRISRLRREEAAVTQYRDNIGALKIRLQKNETYMSGMINDMHQARDLLVWALDGGNSSDDLNAMAGSLQSLRDSLFYSANSKDQEGRYVFSGTLISQPALTYDGTAALGARYSFTGNTAQQQVAVGNGITQPANVDLSGMEALLNLMDSTIATLRTAGVSPNDPVAHQIMADGLDGIDVAMGAISTKIADLGGTQNILSTLDTNHANVSLSNKMALTDIAQLDYASAAVELNGYTMALQATQKAYAKVSGLSLFNVL